MPSREREPDGVSWHDIDRAIEAAAKAEGQLPPSYRETKLPDGLRIISQYKDVAVGNIGGKDKWLATFQIIESSGGAELVGYPILRSWNIPLGGRLSPQHHLAIDWQNVTKRRPLPLPPQQQADVSREDWIRAETRRARRYLGSFLKDIQVEARTHVVARRMDRQSRKWVGTPEDARYSVIDLIESCTAGCPRVLRRLQRGTPG